METISQSIAIVGFPETGKTSLKRQLDEVHADQHFKFIEMPGIFMLGRNTPQEATAYDFLLGRGGSTAGSPPSGIIALADASDLGRQLYLVFQLIDLRLPCLLCITGEQDAAAKGLTLNIDKLSSLISVNVVSLSSGIAGVFEVLADWQEKDVDKVKRQPAHWRPSTALADAYQLLDSKWIHKHLHLYTGARLIEGLRLLTVPKAVEEYEGHPAYESLLHNLDEARKMLVDRNEKWTTVEVIQRSNWIGQVLQSAVTRTEAENSLPGGLKWWRSLLKGSKLLIFFLLLGCCASSAMSQQMDSHSNQDNRPRAREIGVVPGILPPGPLNAITDVAGVKVGHVTLIEGQDVRTGATAILPHGGNLYQDKVPAGVVIGNGYGKLMGTTQIVELGEIETPIVLTNTLSVPQGAEAILDWTLKQAGNEGVRSVNAVVGETNDGFLNDIRKRSLRSTHILQAIESATGGLVVEGVVGAGTGTIAFGWKGGIGTSSRKLPASLGGYTVGVLVQTNFGGVLEIVGVPVGKILGQYYLKDALDKGDANGSIMVVIATDAPLSDRNLMRLARRALLGIGRTGSPMTNGSGDYVISFSTAASVRRTTERRSVLSSYTTLPNNLMSPLFQATVESTEEAIYNALFKATTVTGHRGTIHALPLDRIVELFRQ